MLEEKLKLVENRGADGDFAKIAKEIWWAFSRALEIEDPEFLLCLINF